MAKPNSDEFSINDVSLVAVKESKRVIPESPKKAYAIRSKVVPTEKSTNTDRLQQLMAYLLAIGGQDFTGYIKINYSQGSIGRVERFEEILRKRSCQENS
jgi:hypothetical protein